MNKARSQPGGAPRLVVGVGAPAGGLDALEALLSSLPPDAGLAVVVARQVAATHDGMSTELLSCATTMQVIEAQDGERLVPDRVHLIQPDTLLGLRDGCLRQVDPDRQGGAGHPIDRLFASLARELGSRSVGILLSGAGSDGTSGLRDIRQARGLTIVQGPSTPGQDGLPRGAREAGASDLVLTPPEISAALRRFLDLPPARPLGGRRRVRAAPPRVASDELAAVNARLREKVERIERVNDDLLNMFSGTNLATLFLDEALRVKRFTPAAAALLRLDLADIGRCVADFEREPLRDGLGEDAKSVLTDLTPRSREICIGDGRWVLRSALPYRTESQHIEGVVVNLLDITAQRESAERLADRERQQAVLARLGLQALEEPDLQAFMDHAVREVQQVLGADFTAILELQPGEQTLLLRAGQGWSKGAVGTAVVGAGLDSHAGFTLKSHGPVIVDDLTTERRFSASALLRQHGATSGVSCVIGMPRRPYGVLGVHCRARMGLRAEDAHFVQTVATLVASAVSHHQSHVRLRLEGAVARAIARASSLTEALRGIHTVLCEALHGDMAELWLRERDGQLRCRQVTVPGTEHPDPAWRRLSEYCFSPGEGLVGRVYASGRAEWMTSLSNPARFPRIDAAGELGIASGVGMPVRAGDEVLGVITVLSRRRLIADEILLGALNSIGIAVGTFQRKTEAESELLENERRKAAVLDASPDAVVTTDHRGRVIGFNVTAERLFQYRREDIVGLEMADLIVPSGLRAAHRAAFARHVETGASTVLGKRMLLRGLRKDGSEFPAEITVCRVGSTEQPLFTGFVRDVTAQLRADAALAASEERYREIFDNVGVSLWEEDFDEVHAAIEGLRAQGVTDFKRYFADHPEFVARAIGLVKVVNVNQESVRMFGALGKKDLLDSLDSVFTPETHPTFAAQLVALAEGRRSFASEARVKTVTGAPLDVTFTVRFAPPGLDRPLHAMVSVMDITELKQAQACLQDSNQQKDAFIAMLGHELRNPLSAIRNATELLVASPGSRHLGLAVEILGRQTEQMGRLIDGLLDISRVVRGKIPLDMEPVDLREVVRQVLTDSRDKIDACALEVRVELPPEPLVVKADRVRLTQVVENLFSNALKFTPPPGQVIFELSRESGSAVLRAADTGVGIDLRDLPHIFEAFRQGTQPSREGFGGGLGLGLALVHGLVELHGGQVEARSDGPAHGSEFVVKLPLHEQAVAQDAVPLEPEPAGARLLLVEDNVDSSHALRLLLKTRGFEVVAAQTGEEAVRVAREFDPDVVLCDIGLPGAMSGLDVAREMRLDAAFRRVMLVAITGFGQEEDRRRSRAAGFDAHLTKPVSLDALARVIASGAAPCPVPERSATDGRAPG